MTGRNRLAGDKVLAALFVVLAIAGTIWVVYGVGNLSGQQEGRSIEAAAIHEAGGKQLALQACRFEPLNRKTECIYDAAAAAEDAKRAELDLQAQQGMHFWAVSMVLVGFLQTAVAAAALWFLREDLRQNRRSSEAQLRAYICIGALRSDDFAEHGERRRAIFLPLVNSGPTPVLNWNIQWYWQITDKVGRDAYDFVREQFEAHYRNLKQKNLEEFDWNHSFGPAQEKAMPLTVDIPGPLFTKVLTQESHFYLLGVVNYQDIFRKSRTTEFFYCYNIAGSVQFGQMPWHNRMT